MSHEYYLALFNEITWNDFRKKGCIIYGTTKNKEARAKKLNPGDKLICYISHWSVFAGVIEIESPCYLDDSDIWRGENFPVRFQVKENVALDPQSGISVRNYFKKLTIFAHLKNEKSWQGFFLNSLNRFPKEDGEIIVNDLMLRRNKGK
jgi:predicted RNA-binding protein